MQRLSQHIIALSMTLLMLAMTGCDRHKVTPGVLYQCKDYTLSFDSLAESNGTVAKAISSMELMVTRGDTMMHHWKIDDLNNRYVRATMGMKLPDALYNMAISEIVNDTVSTLTPAAITLALAYIDPELSMQALRARVKNGRIKSSPTQAWPIDVSRIQWIPAAWEVYKTTGDEAWLREFYAIAKRTLDDDIYVNFSNSRGLFSGGIVPLDIAAQYYPSWMNPIDIYTSYSLTANALYAAALHTMAEASSIIDKKAEGNYAAQAVSLGNAINLHFWLPDKGYYSQYLYGEMPIQSPVTDNAGQALCVLYDITRAGMASRLMEKGAVTPYGVPSVWPCTSDEPGQYSGCVRPVTQGLWALAAAKSRNMEQLRPALAAIMRNTIVTGATSVAINAFTGTPVATDTITPEEKNNAAAAGLAMTFRVLAGISFSPDAISFAPIVPADYTEDILISGLSYRNADLSVIIHGTGSKVARFTVDGVAQTEYRLKSDISGRHIVDITLTGANSYNPDKLNKVITPSVTPPIPNVIALLNNCDTIMGVPERATINTYINGAFEVNTDSTLYRIYNPMKVSEYAFSLTSSQNIEGYACRPLLHIPSEKQLTLAVSDYYTGGTTLIEDSIHAMRYVPISATRNSHLYFDLYTEQAGPHLMDVHYANGAGVETQQDHCGMRTLLVNGERAGVIVMPQLGLDDWDHPAFSNFVKIYLDEGLNTITLDYMVPYNINSSGSDTPVLIDYLRLIRLQ